MIASREELLVALTTGFAADSAYDPKIRPTAEDCSGLVREAQAIADAACKAWGHARSDGDTKARFSCARCGKLVRR